MYSFACIVAAHVHLQLSSQGTPSLPAAQGARATTKKRMSISQQAAASALLELDMAAIMGGPLFRPEVDQLIAVAQNLHQLLISQLADLPPAKRQRITDPAEDSLGCSPANQPQICKPQSCNHKIFAGDECAAGRDCSCATSNVGHIDGAGMSPDKTNSSSYLHALPPGSLQHGNTRIPTDHLPPLER